MPEAKRDEMFKNRKGNYSLALTNIVQLGKYSLGLEQNRRDSVIKQAGDMLTAFSVFSAALLMAVPIILEHTNINHRKLMLCIGIAFIPLTASLVTAILAQWRYKYQLMQDAKTLKEYVYKNIDLYKGQEQYDLLWIDQLTQIHESIEKNNDRRVKFLVASIICFLIAIGILVGSIVVLLLT